MNVQTVPIRNAPIVFHFGRLGDMVMLTTLLQTLRQRYGSPCELYAAGPWNDALFASHPDVLKLWTLRRHTPVALSGRWWKAWWRLRRSAGQPIYVSEDRPRQLRRIRWLLWAAGIRRERCVFLPQTSNDIESHWTDRYARFAAMTPAGFLPVPADRAPLPRLHVSAEQVSEMKAWLAQRGWSSRDIILVQPGNYRTLSARREQYRHVDDKAWPLENWVALLRRLVVARPKAVMLVCGAPPEAALISQIATAARHDRVSSAALPLPQFLALCRVAHSMISIDTGPAHAAAALGVPLTVMYGGQSPKKWLPRSAEGSPVLSVGGPPRSRVSDLSVDEVFQCWLSADQRQFSTETAAQVRA